MPFALPFDIGPADEPMTLEADVVIVGSGAGGGVVAAALAEAGRSVVVLEAGPFVDEATMPRDELDAFGRLYLNYGLLATWDGSVTMLAGSGVGGGTLINWMTSIDAPAAVRAEWRRDHGLGGLEDGEAWSDDIATLEEELSVTPARRYPPKDQVIITGAERLGWERAPVKRDSPWCDDCGSCPFGCRRGTKQSGIRVHLARAAAAGARIVPQVRVTKVLIERGRAVGVQGRALIPGTDPRPRVREVIVRSRQVVLAAGALRTPALLQASRVAHGGDRQVPAGPPGTGRRRPHDDAGGHVARADASGTIDAVRRWRGGSERVRHRDRLRDTPVCWRSRCRGRASMSTRCRCARLAISRR